MYKEWKHKLMQEREEQKRQQQLFQQMKIQQNLSNLDQYIKSGRSRSQSDYVGHSKQPKVDYEQSLIQEQQENQVSQKKRKAKGKRKSQKSSSKKKQIYDSKKRELILQFRNLAERFNHIQNVNNVPNEINNDSLRVQGSSLLGLISQDNDESEPGERLDELDTSFFSDRQYLNTNFEEQKNSEFHQLNDFDEQEAKEMAEIRSIEQQAASRSSRLHNSSNSSQNKAASLIQQVWRTYKTRQTLKQYLQNQQQPLNDNEEDSQNNEFDFNALTESQVQQLKNLGYIDSEGNLLINQMGEEEEEQQSDQQVNLEATDQSAQYAQELENQFSSKSQKQAIEKDSSQEEIQQKTLQRTIEENRKQPNEQAQGTQIVFDSEAYNNYIQDMDWDGDADGDANQEKSRWQKMLNYIDSLQKQGSQQNIVSVLSGIRELTELQLVSAKGSGKKRKQLSIDVEKIEEQYDQQMNDMRVAIGSESLIQSLKHEEEEPEEQTIFEQNPFREFASKKFREFLKRENLDTLLQLRVKALEERNRSQTREIENAYKEKKISPKTYNHQQQKLEKWVSKEREELQKKKSDMERGWKGTCDTVLKTHRDIMFMAKHFNMKWSILGNSFSQEHIKIVDNYQSESQTFAYQLSQSQSSENFGFTPMKDLMIESKLSMGPGGIIDIVQQNQVLQEKYQKYEEDLCKSEILIEENFQAQINITDAANNMVTLEELELNLSQEKAGESDLNVPHTSPSPSSKESLVESINSEDDNLQRLGQSQAIKISSLVETLGQNDYSDKQINSYAIIITNMIIASEVQSVYNELSAKNIDFLEVANRHLFGVNLNKKPSKSSSKGIKTNLSQVKLYLIKLVEYIKGNSEKDVLYHLNIPLGPSSKEMLKYLHFNEFGSSSSQFESSSDSTYQHSAILNTELFADMEKYLMDQQLMKPSHEFLLELEHIHNKVVFDALNEALDEFRPFGLKGQPFPWKIDSSKLIQRKVINKDINVIMKKSEERVIEWAQCLVGIIIDKEDSPFPKMLMFDQDYLNQIKEDRLLRMLQGEILDQEDRWINYDEEQTEIEIELSDIVFDTLICEVVTEMYKGKKK